MRHHQVKSQDDQNSKDNEDIFPGRLEQLGMNKPNKIIQKYYIQNGASIKRYISNNQNNSVSSKELNLKELYFDNTTSDSTNYKYGKILLKKDNVYSKSKQNNTISKISKNIETPSKQIAESESYFKISQSTSLNPKSFERQNKKQLSITNTETSKGIYKSQNKEQLSRTQDRIQEFQNAEQGNKFNIEQDNYQISSQKNIPKSQSLKNFNNLHSQSLTEILKSFTRPTQNDIQQQQQNENQNLKVKQGKLRKTLDFEKINYDSLKQFKCKQTINQIPNNPEQSKYHSANSTQRSLNSSTQPIGITKRNNSQSKLNSDSIGHFNSTRQLYIPIQTLKQINSQKKYEESLNSFLQCNNSTYDKDFTHRKNSFPFKVAFDKSDHKFNIKDQIEKDHPSKFNTHINSNKFIKLDQIQQTKYNSFYLPKNTTQLKNQQIGEASLLDALQQSPKLTFQQIPSSKKIVCTDISQILNCSKEEAEKKNQIINTLQNRNQIGKMIRLIEEFPSDLTHHFKLKDDFFNENQNNQSKSKIKKQKSNESISIRNKILSVNSDFIKMDEQQFEEVQQNQKPRLLDISFTQYANQVANETTKYILNKEKLEDFNSYRVKKERKNLDGKAQRANLLKILTYLKNLNLKPRELLNNNVFSKKPFEKPNSYEFITAAKHNNILQCDFFLMKNKYLVYDFDYVYMTALHWGAKRGHAKLCQFLIEKGADVNATDLLGKPPLYYACESNHLDVVKVLLYNKAYPWSTKYVNYDKYEKVFPLVLSALLTARKISVLLKMTPAKQRNLVWQKEYIAFSQILV